MLFICFIFILPNSYHSTVLQSFINRMTSSILSFFVFCAFSPWPTFVADTLASCCFFLIFLFLASICNAWWFSSSSSSSSVPHSYLNFLPLCPVAFFSPSITLNIGLYSLGTLLYSVLSYLLLDMSLSSYSPPFVAASLLLPSLSLSNRKSFSRELKLMHNKFQNLIFKEMTLYQSKAKSIGYRHRLHLIKS